MARAYDAPVKTYEVVVEPSGQSFPAAPEETVLEAAARAGIEMPSSCRTGTCRTCMRRLAAGTVVYRVEWSGLAPEEKAEGWFLPCVACARSPLRIAGQAQRAWWERE